VSANPPERCSEQDKENGFVHAIPKELKILGVEINK
jgi:hypothetical protein